MKRLITLFVITAAIACVSYAQDEPEPERNNEFSIGVGGIFPGETDPLNLPGEKGMPASFVVNIGYRRYLSERLAIGLRGFGTTNRLSGYVTAPASDPSNFHSTEFDLATFTFAFEGLLLLSPPGPVSPYVTAIVGLATGVLTNDDYGSLEYHGAVGGAGVGLRFEVSPVVAVNLEGLASFGGAQWRNRPSSSSSGAQYNPSAFLVLATLTIRTH